MTTTRRLAATALLAVPLFGCSPPWNAKIINDFGVPSRMVITGSGPGRCSSYGELPAKGDLSLDCDMTRGVTIRFTNAAGQSCVAAPQDVAAKVEDGDDGAPVWPKKYKFIRLSRLPCGPASGATPAVPQ